MLVCAKLGDKILINFMEKCIYIGEKPSTSQPQKKEWIILRGLVERNHGIYFDSEIAFDVYGDLEWTETRKDPIKVKINQLRKHLGGPSSLIKRKGSGYQIDPNVPIELEIKQYIPTKDSGNSERTGIKLSGCGLRREGMPTLAHNMPPILDRYIPRPRETAILEEKLDNGHKQIFVCGEGGVGKTEFAISFASSANCKYECFFTTFQTNVEETVLGLNFEGWSAYEQNGEARTLKSREQQYSEKLALLRQMGKNCLLIVDNADIPQDQLLTDPKWRDLERLDIKQLYTTRCEFDKANIQISPFLTEQLYDYLIEHYITKSSFPQKEVFDLIEAVDRHTLTVDIIGRLLKASNGRTTPQSIAKALNQSRADKNEETMVFSEYNRDYTKRSVFDHLQTVFNMTGLSDRDLYVMQCASLLSHSGMNASLFIDAIGSEHEESFAALCKAGWLRLRNNQQFVMHPVIRTVIFYGENTQPRWNRIARFASALRNGCKNSGKFSLGAKNRNFAPTPSVYMCLLNITKLPDIPDEDMADICEVLAWDLYFISEYVLTGDSIGANYLARITLLLWAADCRENILVSNRSTTEGVSKNFNRCLSAFAATWYKIGCLFAEIGDRDYEACYAFRKAAGILLNTNSPDLYFVANCYGYAAYAYYQEGMTYQTKRFLKKAKKYFRRAERYCQDQFLPNSLPPTAFGFSYPEAKPRETWGCCETNDEYWGYTYALSRIKIARRIPCPVKGSYKIYIDPSR